MKFSMAISVVAEAGGPPLDPPSLFIQSLSRLPLCPDCGLLFSYFGFCSRGRVLEDAWSGMRGLRSDFDQMLKKTSGSCPLCFCMQHLIPADLPGSTRIFARLEGRSQSNDLILQVLQGEEKGPEREKRILGYVSISDKDSAPDYRYRLPPTIDFEVITHLIENCGIQHHHHDLDLLKFRLPPILQLIDVEDMMIISVTSTPRYLALSYVWGDCDSFAATSKIRQFLRQRGGLLIYLHEIPQTIKDAMEVVRILGERYLWVDRLCIEQDNLRQKAIHIEKMDAIYSHALLSIIAHAGVAATSPLPGLKMGTRLGLPTKRIDNIVMSVLPPNLWGSEAPHETRGWTLQEQLMSKRCLYFDWHRSWFQCDEGLFVEMGPGSVTRECPYALVEAPISFNVRCLRSYMRTATHYRHLDRIWNVYSTVIERFRTRKLTYAEDTVNAIRGVLELISDVLDVPLVSVVPSTILSRALLFYLSQEGQTAERNEAAPSWSWAGWKGSIYYEDEAMMERVPLEAVALAMRVRPKGFYHFHSREPSQRQLEGAKPHTINTWGISTLQAPLYVFLDIQCYSTKGSAFGVGNRAYASTKRTSVSVVHGRVTEIVDESGDPCGQALGVEPPLFIHNDKPDEVLWILLSRSHPKRVDL